MPEQIGLVDVDSKLPNLALMKLAAWHRKQGDLAGFYSPVTDKPDLIYGSKVFQFTPDYDYYPEHIPVKLGGYGYQGLADQMPIPEQEYHTLTPAYDLYGIDYAMGYTSRGCIRSCPFCVVPKLEGKIKPVADLQDFWTGQQKVMLLDNNLTALPSHFHLILDQAIQGGISLDFTQGLDIRLIDADMAAKLKRAKFHKRLRFAFDHISSEAAVRRGIDHLLKAGWHPQKLTFYLLIGFDSSPEEDLYRVELLRSLNINPFAMPYDKADGYQKAFARWVNHKGIFKSVTWAEYRQGQKNQPDNNLLLF